MPQWKLRILVFTGLAAFAAAITSLLICNLVGISVLGVITGLLIALIPSIPWFLPPIIIWLLLFFVLLIGVTLILKTYGIKLM